MFLVNKDVYILRGLPATLRQHGFLVVIWVTKLHLSGHIFCCTCKASFPDVCGTQSKKEPSLKSRDRIPSRYAAATTSGPGNYLPGRDDFHLDDIRDWRVSLAAP